MDRRPRARSSRAVVAVVAATLVLAAGCTSPAGPERTTPPGSTTPGVVVGSGLDRKVAEYLETFSYGSKVRAVLVSVDGRRVLERYSGTSAAQTRHVASVTNSVISTLVGIALAEGRLRGLDQTLPELLPSHAEQMTPTVAAVTLRHLLTMTAGLPETEGTEPAFVTAPNWVRAILQEGVSMPPGRWFAYSDASSHLLAAILAHATGQSVLGYARTKLFDPLGIVTRPAAEPVAVESNLPVYERAGFAWPTDPQGIHTGGAGLKMAPKDLLTLGELYLGEGRWRGKQLVPAAWVHAATTRQVTANNMSLGGGYGYQWWPTTAAGDPAYAAIGYGGQLIEVVPRRHLVVVVSSDVDEDDLAGIVDGRALVTMVSTVIAPTAPRT